MSFKENAKKVFTKIKNAFIRTDAFREHCEDKLAEVLNDMGNYTTLDDAKAKLVQTGITLALSYTPVVGGVTVALTTEQINTLSKEIIKAGHKAEKLMAKQLAKH